MEGAPESEPAKPAWRPRARGRLLRSYRGDVSGTLSNRLFIPSAMIAVGSTLSACGVKLHAVWLSGCGLVSVACGAVAAVVGLGSLLIRDEYVAIREGGISISEGARRRFVHWDNVSEIGVDADDAIVVSLVSGRRLRVTIRFTVAQRNDLVAELVQARRRVAFGMRPH